MLSKSQQIDFHFDKHLSFFRHFFLIPFIIFFWKISFLKSFSKKFFFKKDLKRMCQRIYCVYIIMSSRYIYMYMLRELFLRIKCVVIRKEYIWERELAMTLGKSVTRGKFSLTFILVIRVMHTIFIIFLFFLVFFSFYISCTLFLSHFYIPRDFHTVIGQTKVLHGTFHIGKERERDTKGWKMSRITNASTSL